MRREVHDGLEDVFAPSPMDGVGPCEKIYTHKTPLDGFGRNKSWRKEINQRTYWGITENNLVLQKRKKKRLIRSDLYQWRVWLWPRWGSRLGSAPQTRLTEPSLGRWGSGWTGAAPLNSPRLWSAAELCSQHWGKRQRDSGQTFLILVFFFLCFLFTFSKGKHIKTTCVWCYTTASSVHPLYHRCSWFWLVWGTAARLCRWLSSWTR